MGLMLLNRSTDVHKRGHPNPLIGQRNLLAFQNSFFFIYQAKLAPHTTTLSHGIAVVGVPKKKWIWAHGSRGKEDKSYHRP